MQAAEITRRAPGRGGRPTRAEAERRQRELLEIAGEMFMKHGFDGTSVDGVAEAAAMSKRTLYARFGDKNELFSAVLRGLIDRWLVPINQFRAATTDLEPMLMEIGHHLLTSALAPQAVSLNRIIIAESERRPEFGLLAYAEGRRPAIRAIAAALARHTPRLRVDDLEGAADQFMSLIIEHSLRMASLGIGPSPFEVEIHVRAAVDLFLNGAVRR
jgi:AcrR family transcriptional regulator